MTFIYHTPVLLSEVLEGLKIKPSSWYIDGTLGGGGYTEGILSRGGKVLAIDADKEALHYAKKKLSSSFPDLQEGKDWILVHDNFQNMKDIVTSANIKCVSGITLDLGISSFQLDTPSRGFSYRFKDAPFDLRLDQSSGKPAFELLNTSSNDDLYDIITRYGEEERAESIVSRLVFARGLKKLVTIGDVIDALDSVRSESKDRLLARVFQAFRIEVNQELESLKNGLMAAQDLLMVNGRIAVVSFHSLEDRIVKRIFNGKGWEVIGSFIKASISEREINSRSRSATLRIAEKLKI